MPASSNTAATPSTSTPTQTSTIPKAGLENISIIAIVIISLGLIVVNNTRGTVDKSNLSEQEIQTFNAKFTPYVGTISGNKLKQLCQTVIASNQNNSNKVTLEGVITDATNTTGITNGGSYTVTIDYDPDTGLVKTIRIS